MGPDGCIAGSHADCRGSIGCKRTGRCAAWVGQCVVGSVADCKRSAACATEGACTPRQGRCIAGSNVDCQGSVVCHQFERCIAHRGWCRTELVMHELAEEETSAVRTGLSVKLAAGAAYAVLKAHPIGAFVGHAALGLQIRDIGAFHFDVDLWKGETDQGLDLFMASGGPAWEFVLWRFRPGLGLQVHWVSVDRATTSRNMTAWGWSPALFLDVDVIQNEHANLFVGAKGGVGEVSRSLRLYRLSLSLGGRFKHP